MDSGPGKNGPDLGRVTLQERSGTSSSYVKGVGLDGEFTVQIVEGEITITADWEGDAPAYVGPLLALPGGSLDNGEVVLTSGFAGRLSLTGPNDAPVDQARIEARLDAPASSQPRQYEVGEDGIATIEHAAEHPYELTVTAPGYERKTFNGVRLAAGKTVSLTLMPTEAATGLVTDERGEPIEGPVLRLFARWKPGMSHTYGTGPVLATTDAEGRFTIDTLSEDERTAVLVEAEGRGSEVREVAPGETGVTVRLAPERVLRGEIVGDLSKLDPRYVSGSEPLPTLHYSAVVTLFENPAGRDETTGLGKSARVVPDETSGDPPRRATFELRDLLPGELTISAGPMKRTFEPFNGLKEGVTIVLDESHAGDSPRREVVIRFDPPEPELPSPTGDVRLDLQPAGEDAARRHEQFRRPVEKGRIEVAALAPGTVSLLNEGLIGYWFDEAVIGTVGHYHAFAVPEGDDPFEFTIPVVAAGAIRGTIRMAGGGPPINLQGADLQCYFAAERGRGANWTTAATLHPNAAGEFFVTPVPLGRTCHVILEIGRTKVFSEPITLTPERPIADGVTLKVPELVSATVQVVDAEGRPVADQKVEISRSYAGWFTNHTGGGRTDEFGRVTIDGLAGDALNQYGVFVEGEDYRPLAEAKLGESGDETVLKLPASSGR